MSVSRICAVLSLSLLAWACNQEPPPPEEGTRAEPLATASGAQRRTPTPLASSSGTPRRPTRDAQRPRGMGGQFLTAALALDLKDDQRETVKKLQEANSAEKPEDPRAGMQELNREIAAGIKAGKIEPAKLEPQYAEMEKAEKARHEAQAKTLNDLHAALTPEQRKALVTALETKQAEKAGLAPPGGSAVATPPEPKVDPAKEKERKAEMTKRELERMTRELGLDETQQKEVEKLIAKKKEEKSDRKAIREANKKRMTKLLAEFQKDKFDAAKLELSAKSSMRDHAKSMVDHLNALLKVIKPEQRDKLAASVERGHGAMGGRGPMGGRPGGYGGWARGGGRGGPGGPVGGPGAPAGPGGPPADDTDDGLDD